MHKAPIAQEVRRFITTDYFLGRDDDALEDSTSFLEEGILDSTGVLQLITFLEETFGIKVENEEVVPDNLDSISKVVSYLSRKLSACSPAECQEFYAGNGERRL